MSQQMTEGRQGMAGKMGQGMGQGMGMMPGMGTGGPGGKAGGGTTGDGPATENIERQQGTGDYVETQEGQSEAGSNVDDVKRSDGKGSSGRAWFTSLPEAIRGAVRSRGKTLTPKGYEELLRRYFEDQK